MNMNVRDGRTWREYKDKVYRDSMFPILMTQDNLCIPIQSRGELIQMQQAEYKGAHFYNESDTIWWEKHPSIAPAMEEAHPTRRTATAPSGALNSLQTHHEMASGNNKDEILHIPWKSDGDDADLCLEILWAAQVSEMSAAAAALPWCHSLIGQ